MVDAQSGHGYVPLAMQGHRQRIRGLAAREQDPEAAEGLLREALAIFDEWGARLWQARVEVELGEWLVSRARPDDGEELAERGRAALADLEDTAGSPPTQLRADSRAETGVGLFGEPPPQTADRGASRGLHSLHRRHTRDERRGETCLG